MPADQVTVVTRRGLKNRIFDSVFGAFIGVVMFLGSFVLLWTNEGSINWGDVARGSTAVDAAAVSAAADGKFVAVTGQLVTGEQLGDAPYLQAGAYLRLERSAEMFAWEEKRSSESDGDTNRTTYTYSTDWTSSPQDSSEFQAPAGHTNPRPEIESESWTVSSATVGAYGLDMGRLGLPGGEPVTLNDAVLAPGRPGKLDGGYLFIGRGTLQKPQVGDMRISYEAVPSGVRATVFGTQSQSSVEPYLYRGETSFYRAVAGGRAEAIETLQTEYTMMLWIMRFVGFFLMWGGLSLAFSPLTSMLKLVPLLGNLGAWVIGAITFGVALALTLVTVIISIIAHNLLLLVVILVLILGGAFYFSQRAQRDRPAAAV
jgi:Transmembrane protein 43